MDDARQEVEFVSGQNILQNLVLKEKKFNAFGYKFKNMIQNIIKKVLRKWLKKTVYSIDSPITNNIARFEWVYNSPLHQWRDRIWVVNHYPFKQKEGYDKCLKEYLYK